MQHIKIRAASMNDLEQLNELMFQLHDEHHQQCSEHFKSAEEIEQEKSIARYIDDPECIVFVACVEESVVGFVSGHFCELVSTVSKPVQMGSIDELYVIPSSRGTGVAKKLCQKIEHRFEEYGVKQIFVEVWEFNQSAIQFYNQSGFEHHIHWMRKAVTS
ncbi:N-acetyltransferase family protein [Vibrio sp. TBV020]|uniref:GNAT family N-acetyltransferase n=1 Tax=Vibrio sp. TBV020 TaxID=3137398 RepID=UPI0038CDAC13